jgi:hypothetical protein
MMNNNKGYEANIALNETRTGNDDKVRKGSAGDNTVSHNFGITDLWSIRRNNRKFRIHNRIPRL